MKKKPVKKTLTLKRETIQRLDSSELEAVNGGTLGPVVSLTARLTPHTGKLHTDRLGGALTGIGPATKQIWDHRPKGNPNDPPSVVTATA